MNTVEIERNYASCPKNVFFLNLGLLTVSKNNDLKKDVLFCKNKIQKS